MLIVPRRLLPLLTQSALARLLWSLTRFEVLVVLRRVVLPWMPSKCIELPE